MAIVSKYSKDYLPAINRLSKPEYESPYDERLQDVIDKILNQGDFSYDFANDPTFKQYKDQYITLGKDAVQNAVSASSALTGGYGNSYSSAAASQANQQYLTKLNEEIPNLMHAAMQRYQNEQENLYRNYSALATEESREYQKYRDETSDYYTDQANMLNSYQRALEQENYQKEREYQQARDTEADRRYAQQLEYQKTRDTEADRKYAEQFAYEQARDTEADRRYAQELAYQKERDTVSDTRWQKEFEYQQSRDTASDEKWRLEREFEKARALVSDEQWNKQFNYKKERDNVSDQQWQKTLDYNYSRANAEDAQWQAKFDFNARRDLVADEQWQKEFELKQLQQAMKTAKSSSGGSGRRSGGSGGYEDVADSFFKMRGTAAVKNYSGNTVDNSRNATLSVTKTRNFLNQLLEAGSDSEAQQILNSWAESGYISEGDYNYLVDYYEKLRERGISQLKEWKAPKTTTTTNAGAKQSTTKNSTKEEKSSNIFKRAIEKVKQLTK